MPDSVWHWHVSATNCSTASSLPLAERYKDAGVFGPTLIASILYMITSGCTASTQYAYAEMLRLSTEGKINFVEDTREYAVVRNA